MRVLVGVWLSAIGAVAAVLIFLGAITGIGVIALADWLTSEGDMA